MTLSCQAVGLPADLSVARKHVRPQSCVVIRRRCVVGCNHACQESILKDNQRRRRCDSRQGQGLTGASPESMFESPGYVMGVTLYVVILVASVRPATWMAACVQKDNGVHDITERERPTKGHAQIGTHTDVNDSARVNAHVRSKAKRNVRLAARATSADTSAPANMVKAQSTTLDPAEQNCYCDTRQHTSSRSNVTHGAQWPYSRSSSISRRGRVAPG